MIAAKGVVADLGGTNARFAQAEIKPSGEVLITDMVQLKARDYKTSDDAIAAYLKQAPAHDPQFVSIACAGPIIQGEVSLTNLGWTLSTTQLEAALHAKSTHLINDLAAVGWAAPRLTDNDLRPIGDSDKAPRRGDVIAVLGIGTGTNCAAFVAHDEHGVVVAGEAGHITFAPADELEIEIWRNLTQRYGRLSIERVASGPGLFNIYLALCDINGHAPQCKKPEEVSALADHGDATAEQTLDRFCRMLGSIAGDFVLNFGAAALHVAGGVVPSLMTTPQRAQAFRDAFENKGRFRTYLEVVGAFIITHPHAALVGAALAAAFEPASK